MSFKLAAFREVYTPKVLFCLKISLYFTNYENMLQRHTSYIKLPSHFLTCWTRLNLLLIMTYWSSDTVSKLIECHQRTASSESTDLAHSRPLKYMKRKVLSLSILTMCLFKNQRFNVLLRSGQTIIIYRKPMFTALIHF